MIDLRRGDMLSLLPAMEADSIAACVTDPPYHLAPAACQELGHPSWNGNTQRQRTARAGFMGKQWDGGDIAFRPETWAAVLRVLKPGGYLLAFASTRGYHRMVCAIEDAGFVIHPMLGWIFATGFPKATKFKCTEAEGWRYGMQSLKPALEPICMAQKPMIGTGTENWLRHGTGGINVDACRIPACDKTPFPVGAESIDGVISTGLHNKPRGSDTAPSARWPANVVHDGSADVLRGFPESFSNGGTSSRGQKGVIGWSSGDGNRGGLGDSGSAARFFYTAKADKGDRADSRHPTVKPVDLMRWLVRLVTPPDGTVLDPFVGSGTTGEAAMLEGFDAILIEREAEHAADIAHRVKRWHGGDLPLFAS